MSSKPNQNQKGPFWNAAFHLTVRNRLINELVKKHGYTRADARDEVAGITDDMIDGYADHVSGGGPKVGAGGIIAAILAFIQSPQFAELIKLLLSVLVTDTDAPPQPGIDLPPAPSAQ